MKGDKTLYDICIVMCIVKKLRHFKGFWVLFDRFMSFLGLCSMIFACVNWPGPEVKSHFAMFKNSFFFNVFWGAFEVILIDFG
jgi:hypothetical protein